MTLQETIDRAIHPLVMLEEDSAAYRPAAGRWSKKEILGHLIDSALNNHQRFVRAQFDAEFVFPSYEQERWVTAQRYQDTAWEELVGLWLALNRHLARVIAAIPPEALGHRVALGGRAPVTLEWLIEDYQRHLQHHLAQILDH